MIKTAITFALNNSKTAGEDTQKHYLMQSMHLLEADGATWTAHAGGYRMADGSAVFEPSYTVDVLTAEPIEPDKVRRLADYIKYVEHQESVLVETTTVNAQFI